MRAICYHRVLAAPPTAAGAYVPNAITAEQLTAHAAELARRWRVLPLEEIVDRLETGRPLPDRAVHISFDDGYRDNLIAAEIFEAHRLPWTLFVISDAVLDGYAPWFARLSDALGRVTGADAVALLALKARVKGQVMRAPAKEHLEVLDRALAEAGLDTLGAPVDAGLAAATPFLNDRELAELAGRGVEIGNHSATHPNLVKCGDAELTREIGGSRDRLERALGRSVPFFAYPDGRFDSRVLKAAGDSHRAAMATWTSRAPLAPLRLRRYSVGPTVDDLRAVLAPDYPARYRRMRLKWAVRRNVRRVQAQLAR